MCFAGRTCVAARMNQKRFERPVDVGDITITEAHVTPVARRAFGSGSGRPARSPEPAKP